MSKPEVNDPDAAGLDQLRGATLGAWRDVDRGGAQLLFVLPFFLLPLSVASYFLLPQVPVVALIPLLVLAGGLLYLWRGRRRLRTQPAALIWGRLKEKRVHQSTDRATHKESRWHSFVIVVERKAGLALDGTLTQSPAWLGDEPTLSVTQPIYECCETGEQIVAAVMPHDRAIYHILDGSGTLFPALAAKDPPAPT